MNTNKFCCVFVSNKKYFDIFKKTCHELIINGKYQGDICLVIGDDLRENKVLNCDLIKKNKISIKYFPDIKFTSEFLRINNNVRTDGRNILKKFQWHKLYLFNSYFKKWNYIFYLDCGMKIHKDIKPILEEAVENTLFAHSDAYPNYEWKLLNQFDHTNIDYFSKLNDNYQLNIDYFQSGILLYDTEIIHENTFNDLYQLSLNYPISKTNEQGIMNLYFNCKHNLWKQIPLQNSETKYYDYCSRIKGDTNYIITKIKNW